jgi:AcrR family transcriptional regulator
MGDTARRIRLKTKTGRPAGRDYHHGNLKNVLIEAAISQIATHGARTLSLRELSRSIGVSHASTYRHFPNKETVLATIAEQGFEKLTRAMESAARPHMGDALAMLQATGVAYVEFGVSYPHHLQVMFGDLITHHDNYPALVEASKKAYEVLVSVVREGQRTGRIRAQDERLVTLAAWSQVHGLAMLIASGQIRAEGAEPIEYKSLAASVIALLRDGLSVKAIAGRKRALPSKT